MKKVRKFSLTPFIYIIVIFCVSFFIGGFMAFQISSEAYNPTPLQCIGVQYEVSSCTFQNSTFFDVVSTSEERVRDVSMYINGKPSGLLQPGRGRVIEVPINQTYTLEPRVRANVCYSEILQINHRNVEEC